MPATVAAAGANTTFAVPSAGDLSTPVATASPTTSNASKLAVAPGSDKSTIPVTEEGTTPFGFHPQVTADPGGAPRSSLGATARRSARCAPLALSRVARARGRVALAVGGAMGGVLERVP